MTVKLKKLMGDAGACLDSSMGGSINTLYEVLKELVDSHQQVVAQFNQFRTDYNATTAPTTATALDSKVELE
jgi:cysteine synthase